MAIGVIPYIALMALGTAVQMKAQADAVKRSREATRRAQLNQLQYRDRATAVIDKALENWQGPNRIERGVTIEGEILDRSREAIDRADEQGFGEVRPSIQGNVSSAYDKGRAEATTRRKADALELARILAKVQTPGRLRTNEGLIFGDTSTQLGTLGNFARGAGQVDSERIRRAGIPDSGAMMIGGLASGIGSSGIGAG